MAIRKVDDDDDERAVFVDTSLNTRLAVLIPPSPSFSFSSLKERIVMQHFKCFPKHGEIKITALQVCREGKYYHVSESMLVKTAFRGIECWFVFVDVFDWPMIACNPVDKALGIRDSEVCGSTKKRRKKKSKNKDTEMVLESTLLKELPSSEKIHWFERSDARVGASLLESKCLIPGFNGKLPETANLIEQSGGDTTKMDVRYGDLKMDGHVHDEEVVDPLKSAKKRKNDKSKSSTPDKEDLFCTRQKKYRELADTIDKGTDTSSGKTRNLERVVITTGDTSGPPAKKTKKTKNKGVDGVDISDAAELHHVPDIMTSGVAAPDKWDEMENDNGKLAYYIKENVETENTVKKRKRGSSKTSVTEKEYQSMTSQNQSPELSVLRQGGKELLKEAEIGKPKQDLDKTRSQAKQSILGLDTSEISVKDQLNEKMKELVTPATVERVYLRNKGDTDDQCMSYPEESGECPGSQVFVDLAEGIKRDKPKSAKQKMKKIKDKEKTFHLNSQGKNDGGEAIEMRQIDDDLLQPAINSNLGEKGVVKRGKAMKKSKKRQTDSAADISEFPMTDEMDDGKGEMVAVKSDKAMKKSEEMQTASAADMPEIPLTDEMDEGKGEMVSVKTQPYGDCVIDSTEHQSVINKRHDGLANNVPVQQVSDDVTDVRKMDKPQTSKINRNNMDETSSNWVRIDKSKENEGAYQVDHGAYEADQTRLIDGGYLQQPQANELEVEISSNKARKKAQKKQSASAKVLMELPGELQPVAKLREACGTLLPPSNYAEFDSNHQQEASLLDKDHDGLAEERSLEKRKARKSKHKKRDLPSSVDTLSVEHQAVTSRKTNERQRNVVTLNEPQNDVQEEHSSQMDTQPLHLHQVEEANSGLTKGNSNSVKHQNRVSVAKGHQDEFGDIPSQEVLSNPAEVRESVKPWASKQKVKNVDLPSSLDTASKGENLTVSSKKGGTTCLDGSQLQEPITGKPYDKTPLPIATQPTTSRDISARSGHDLNLLAETRVEENHVTKSGVPNPNWNDGSRTSATSGLRSGSSPMKTELRSKRKQEHGVFKTPSTKIVGKAVNPLPQKKGLPVTPSGTLFGDLSSESSDDDKKIYSSSSTQTLSEELSSDYSEVESKGHVMSSRHDSLGSGSGGKDKSHKTDANVSPPKNMDLKAILKSSSRFKKVKLMASQSMEDIESQPLEVVPDSQV